MKLLIAVLLAGLSLMAIAQNAPKAGAQNSPKTTTTKSKVPKYNPAAEAVYKGTVSDIRDRQCAVSGGMGSHIIMKLASGEEIEVHLATVEFTKMLEMHIEKGDEIQVTGWKTEFEGVQTIFAREIRHGQDVYSFRTKEGAPAWVY